MKKFVKITGVAGLILSTACSQWAGREVMGLPSEEELTACPETCDVTVSDRISFDDFEAAIRGGTDTNSDGDYQVCLKSGTEVLNSDLTSQDRIDIDRFVSIIGCKGGDAKPKIASLRTEVALFSDGTSDYLQTWLNHSLISVFVNEEDLPKTGAPSLFIADVDLSASGVFAVAIGAKYLGSGTPPSFTLERSEIEVPYGCARQLVDGFNVLIR